MLAVLITTPIVACCLSICNTDKC